MSHVRWLNELWRCECRGAARAWTRGTNHVAETQANVLREILRAGQATDWGRQASLDQIRSPREFQARVPLANYETLRPWIDAAARGQPGVLSNEPIQLFQPTSGSTGGEKLIPYTPLLRQQFQRAIQTWIYDLSTQMPAIRRGPAYWSITPASQQTRRTVGGIPIGFDDDLEYLRPWMRRLAGSVMAVPSSVARLQDPEHFRYATLCHLMACENLSLISVWSPTFLTSLIGQLERWFDSICSSIATGELPWPRDRAAGLAPLPARPLRAARLREIVQQFPDWGSRLRAVWPNLVLISCWCDGASSFYRTQLDTLFPGVTVQPKGLLATEAVVSIPCVGRPGAALAVTSHFFEFLPCSTDGQVDEHDRPRLAHELERETAYQVVVTTGGGLYRYRLGDVVQVVDFVNECPLLQFMGRAFGVSDLVGEKLAESHVSQVLSTVCSALDLAPRFSLLAPHRQGIPRYRLYLECDRIGDDLALRVAERLELGLQENPHYRYAVAIGQLRPVEMCQLRGEPGVGWRVYQQVRQASGQKLGEIKPVSCDSSSDWSDHFAVAVRCSSDPAPAVRSVTTGDACGDARGDARGTSGDPLPWSDLPPLDRVLLQHADAWPQYRKLDELSHPILQQVTDQYGLDYAVALLYTRLLRTEPHAALFRRIRAADREPSAERRYPVTLAFCPGAYYREITKNGADGRVLREAAEPFVKRVELVATGSAATVAENGRLICDWLRQRPRGERIVLASLSKGACDIKAAMARPEADEAFGNVRAWINVSGGVNGLPIFNWMLDRPQVKWLYRSLFWCRGLDWQVVPDLRWGPGESLDFELRLPPHVRLISVVGFPLARHIRHPLLRKNFQRMAPWGPNDGLMLLWDSCQLPGELFPVWGADHFMRPNGDSRSLAKRLAGFMIQELADYDMVAS